MRRSTSRCPFTAAAPELVYRQNLLTVGGEADIALGPGKATLGIAYDHAANPHTGDKDGQPATGAAAFSAACRAPLGGGWELGLSGGRRNRFPSVARSLWRGARPVPAQSRISSPSRPGWPMPSSPIARSGSAVTINPFVNRMDGTIAQRMVTVGGRRLRQRFNLSGSWSYGLDLAARAKLSEMFAVEVAATLLRARADRGELPFRDLVQRPWLDLEAALVLTPSERWSLRAEVQHVGRAYDLAPDGSRARLAAGTELNLRARWAAMKIGPGHRLWLTGSVDNLTEP